MTSFTFEEQRPLDAIVLGRAGVDLYAREANTDMADISGFNMFVGGSAANIAVGISKLGGRVGFISCVAQDAFGDYVKRYMSQQNIDLTGMKSDASGSRTSVAFTEMKPKDCTVLIYRNNASDLTLAPEDIDQNYLATAKVLVVTGTALAQSPSREATLLAMECARKANTKVVLDVDYRPYSWRSDVDAALYYDVAAGLADIVIGNREEFDMMETIEAPGNRDDDQTAARFLRKHTQVVVIKAGELGSKVYSRDQEKFAQGIFKVTANKPFGSGDAFAAGLIWTLTHGGSLEEGVRNGSAAAAINVSGDSCTEAMPSKDALFEFIANHTEKHRGQ